ncbi:hypothetical protein GH714_008868 [Hevea brasiliensis]|uniref:Uncharacterized protein n=1 Tax=Hevea brasiliensis TaxID=3981 RepID=A0A6A6M1W1_HEVBR|nr:hypothetical protein GH714_008868 [Hevea brasiliensis]
MENSYETCNGNGLLDNGHTTTRHTPYQPSIKVPTPWLDLRVFFVRVSKCEIDDSTPEFLTVNHIPLHPDMLFEVNGIRISVNSDGPSIVLRRDRLDKKSEEATFVSTDSIRINGSVKFERWSMNCESDVTVGTSFLKEKQYLGSDSALPTVEVYVAGSFSGTPIILSKTLQLCFCQKQIRKGMLDYIPEYEATEGLDYVSSRIPLQMSEYSNHKPENEEDNHLYSAGTEYLEGEDGELSGSMLVFE